MPSHLLRRQTPIVSVARVLLVLAGAAGPALQEPPPAKPPAALAPTDLARRARAAIEAMVEKDAFSGAVLVAKGDEVLLRDAWGPRDRARLRPNTVETRFNIGSITKNFTGVAVARLVEQGKLEYDTLVGEILPDYPNEDVRTAVRVRHLLTHSSGVPDYWRPWFARGKPAVRNLADYRRLFERLPLQFAPGSAVRYSNSGVVILGLIIEAISGQDYYEHVRDHVFAPAGMKHTAWLELDRLPDDAAVGYRPSENGRRAEGAPFNPVRGSPAGGTFSTVDDLFRFARALHDGTLVGEATRELITTRKVHLQPGVGYGYLFFDIRSNGRRYVGHDGGSEGVNAEFHMFPESGHVLIILANYERAADEVAGRILDLIVGR